jgi:molybdopterin converting factor small subunit
MAHVRLFANLREAAGTGRVDIDGGSVRDVVETACEQFGTVFSLGVEHSRLWLNGEPTELDAPVVDTDELAMIPPVSGGAQVYTPQAVGVPQEVVVAVVLWSVLSLANLPSNPSMFVALLVAVFSLWTWDLRTSARSFGRHLGIAGPLAGIIVGAVGTVFFAEKGNPEVGMGLALAAAVVVGGITGVINSKQRNLVAFSSSILLGVVPGMAVASLAATRLGGNGRQYIWVFLGTAAFAVVGTWILSRLSAFKGLDPFMVGTIGAVLSGLLVALILNLSVVEFLVISLMTALALVAGRALGTVTRTGQMFSQDGAPGWLALLDGTALAGAVFLPTLLIWL